MYAFAYKYVWFLYWIIKNSNVLYPLYSIMPSKFHTNNKCQFPSINYAYVQAYSFFICLESYNINILIMYKEVSLIPLFSCHLSNWKFIYGKFMTLLCIIPSKTVVKLIRCLFFKTMHYILALLRLVSFFFFYPGWIILHFLSKSIGNGCVCSIYCMLNLWKELLHLQCNNSLVSHWYGWLATDRIKAFCPYIVPLFWTEKWEFSVVMSSVHQL